MKTMNIATSEQSYFNHCHTDFVQVGSYRCPAELELALNVQDQEMKGSDIPIYS